MEDEDYMDEAAPSQGEDASIAHASDMEEGAVPENKLALVQTSFFSGPVRPGDRFLCEVVDCYENECSLKVVEDESPEDADMQDEPEIGMEDTDHEAAYPGLE